MPRTRNISARSRRLSLYRRRQSTTSAITSLGYCVRFKQATAPFVELLCAIQTAEPAIALRGALRPLLDRGRTAFRAMHVGSPLKGVDRSHGVRGPRSEEH